jgi:hypothetical protein
LSTSGGKTRISLTVKAYNSFSPLCPPKPSSSLTLASMVCTPSVMWKTYSSPLIATFVIGTPKSIQRHKNNDFIAISIKIVRDNLQNFTFLFLCFEK